MVKTVIVTLTGTIPDSALSVDATVTVNGVAYTGKVTGIVTHENQSQAPTPPEKIRKLPEWEQDMAQEALDRSRDLRHKLETVKNMDDLSELAADTEEFYRYLNREWQSKRIEDCPDCERAGEMALELTHVDVDTESPSRRRQKLMQEIRRRK